MFSLKNSQCNGGNKARAAQSETANLAPGMRAVGMEEHSSQTAPRQESTDLSQGQGNKPRQFLVIKAWKEMDGVYKYDYKHSLGN